MKIIYTLTCILLCASCSTSRQPKIVGTYTTNCVIYDMFPLLVAEFKSDSTFAYKRPCLEKFGGTWKVKNDTVFLYSDKFRDQIEKELTPMYNYTDLKGKKDAFLIRGKKLFPITSGPKSKCALFKVKAKKIKSRINSDLFP